MKILAYDDPEGLKALQSALEKVLDTKFRFRGYSDATIAFNAADWYGYDVFFVDVNYKNDGYPLIGMLLDTFPETNVIATAETLSGSLEFLLMQQPISRILFKPYDIGMLRYSMEHLEHPIKDKESKFLNAISELIKGK